MRCCEVHWRLNECSRTHEAVYAFSSMVAPPTPSTLSVSMAVVPPTEAATLAAEANRVTGIERVSMGW